MELTAIFPGFVTLSGIVIFVKASQPSKALPEIDVTVSGIITLLTPEWLKRRSITVIPG
jgi:hypothetical protein